MCVDAGGAFLHSDTGNSISQTTVVEERDRMLSDLEQKELSMLQESKMNLCKQHANREVLDFNWQLADLEESSK